MIKFFIVLVYTTIQQRSKTVKTNKICPVNISNTITFMIRNYVNGNLIWLSYLSLNEFVLKFVHMYYQMSTLYHECSLYISSSVVQFKVKQNIKYKFWARKEDKNQGFQVLNSFLLYKQMCIHLAFNSTTVIMTWCNSSMYYALDNI